MITIREGSVLGVARRIWTVDETVIGPVGGDSFSFGPEARVLLGEIMPSPRTCRRRYPPDGSPALLSAIGIADPPGQSGITLRTEALERFLADPVRELRARLLDDADTVRDALAAFAPGGPVRRR